MLQIKKPPILVDGFYYPKLDSKLLFLFRFLSFFFTRIVAFGHMG